ncbi:MAG TPA: LacI family DNA-binding transcriptional regulator [Chthonomonadales bacterium]|nr:LacI family DNA-binding transcriptional regulator [Chthonomonadales bacterium]
MPTRRARLKDVADRAGVSPTTASFVLNGRTDAIPESTRQRVLDAAAGLNYRPHAAARSLATGRTRRIGIVLNQPESFSTRDTFFSEILAGIVERSTEHDRNVLLLSAHYPDWRSLYADITGGAADGVLQISRFLHDKLTPTLLAAGFPVVCVSFQLEDERCFSVDCDNSAGGYLAARHLLDLGHRRIAVLYPGEGMSWGAERLQGVRRALADAGQNGAGPLTREWEERTLPDPEWAHHTARWVRDSDPRPTALICCDEIRARMIAECLPSTGLRVPEDVSVVSFNSTEISERCNPPMTSVGQPLPQIGRAAVDLLLARIRGTETPERVVRFPMQLHIRASCSAPRAAAVARC